MKNSLLNYFTQPKKQTSWSLHDWSRLLTVLYMKESEGKQYTYFLESSTTCHKFTVMSEDKGSSSGPPDIFLGKEFAPAPQAICIRKQQQAWDRWGALAGFATDTYVLGLMLRVFLLKWTGLTHLCLARKHLEIRQLLAYFESSFAKPSGKEKNRHLGDRGGTHSAGWWCKAGWRW